MTENDLTLFNTAIQLYNNGQKTTANSHFKNLVQHYPQDVTLLMWLAYSSSELREARAALEQAARLEPHNPNLAGAQGWLAQWEQQDSVLTTSTSTSAHSFAGSTAASVNYSQTTSRPLTEAVPAPHAEIKAEISPSLVHLGRCIDIYEKSGARAFFYATISLGVLAVSLPAFLLFNNVFPRALGNWGSALIIPTVLSFAACFLFGIWGLLVREETLTIYEEGCTIQSKRKNQLYTYNWEDLVSFTYSKMLIRAHMIPLFVYHEHKLRTADGLKWTVDINYKKIKEIAVLLSTLTTAGLLRKITRQLENGETVQINKKITASPQGLIIKNKSAAWQEFMQLRIEAGTLIIKTGYMEGNKPKTKGFANLRVMETENALVLAELIPLMATNPPMRVRR